MLRALGRVQSRPHRSAFSGVVYGRVDQVDMPVNPGKPTNNAHVKSVNGMLRATSANVCRRFWKMRTMRYLDCFDNYCNNWANI
jgi:hypothetical protein